MWKNKNQIIFLLIICFICYITVFTNISHYFSNTILKFSCVITSMEYWEMPESEPGNLPFFRKPCSYNEADGLTSYSCLDSVNSFPCVKWIVSVCNENDSAAGNNSWDLSSLLFTKRWVYVLLVKIKYKWNSPRTITTLLSLILIQLQR